MQLSSSTKASGTDTEGSDLQEARRPVVLEEWSLFLLALVRMLTGWLWFQQLFWKMPPDFTSLLWFVDYGPGNSLHTVARWLVLDSKDAGRQVGFQLLLLLGGLIGVLFGLVIRAWRPTLGGFLGGGILTGAIGWLMFVLLFGTLVFHGSLGLGNVLYTSAPWLIYGLVLGSLTFQLNTLWRPA